MNRSAAGGSLEHAGQAGVALRAIVSDPEHGPSALDNPQTTANLLGDLLPDAPRESGLLVAAVAAGLPGVLRGHVAHGLDPATAITLAAAGLADRTAFTADACQWVAGELAIALGLVPPPGQQPTRGATAPLPRSESRARPASRRSQVLTIGAVIVVAAAIAATLFLRSPGSHRPHRAAPGVSTAASGHSSTASPRAVVLAYLKAVNQHDWPRAWRLGGKNLGQSYRQMIAGYRHTRKVVITAMAVRGGAVTVRVLAYETTGAVQTYQLSYLVSGGTITAGQQTLLRTSG